MKNNLTSNIVRVIADIRDHAWLMSPMHMQTHMLNMIDHRQVDLSLDNLGLYYNLRQPLSIDQSGIAYIHVKGSLLNKAPKIYEVLGQVTLYSTIIEETKQAQEIGASSIVYIVDSPGGTVSGVVEAGDAISQCSIPTVAYCAGMACSAAYWLASSCDRVIATGTACVGNVGAIISWADLSKYWENIGVEFKALVSDGADLKSTFHLEPDEAQTAFLQESINQAGEDFRNHVTTHRAEAGATLSQEIFRAGWYSGVKAGELGLIDDIMTLPELVNLMKN